jgi:hypothetical protein
MSTRRQLGDTSTVPDLVAAPGTERQHLTPLGTLVVQRIRARRRRRWTAARLPIGGQ